MPPVVRTPWLANLASAAKSAKATDDHGHRGEAHGQQVQGEGCQKDEDHAHGSGNDRAGMVEFRVQS